MKSIVYAKQSHNKDELVVTELDANTSNTNQNSSGEAVKSLLHRTRLCIEFTGDF